MAEATAAKNEAFRSALKIEDPNAAIAEEPGDSQKETPGNVSEEEPPESSHK